MKGKVSFLLVVLLPMACASALASGLLSGLRPSAWADSVLRSLGPLPAAERVSRLALMADTAVRLPVADDALAVYDAYVAAADAAADKRHGCYARHDLLVTLASRHDWARYFQLVSGFMTFMESNGEYETYYRIGAMRIRKKLEQNDIGVALNYADTLYTHAKRRNDQYGMANALETRGDIFYTLDDAKRAQEHYEKALKILDADHKTDEENIIELRSSITDSYVSVIEANGDYPKLRDVARSWLRQSEEGRKKFGPRGSSNDAFFQSDIFYSLMALTRAYNAMHMPDSARICLERGWAAVPPDELGANYLRRVATEVALADGDAATALRLIDSAMAVARRRGDTRGYFSMMDEKTRALLMLGKAGEAFALKDSQMLYNDSVAHVTISRQLAMTDRHRAEAELGRASIRAAKWAGAALALAICALVAHNIFLSRKNRRLYRLVSEAEKASKQAEASISAKPAAEQTAEEKLYLRLCAAMTEERLFTDPAMSRETLAAHVGSNYQYVANAIRLCADGMTVGAFINKYRLREAAYLLSATDNPIAEVGEEVGFNSRSTFARVFAEAYKMSPRDFRKVSRQEALAD